MAAAAQADPFATIAQPAQPNAAAAGPSADPFAAIAAPAGSRANFPAHTALSDNPNGEGVYQMQMPKGAGAVGIPYSKVDQAHSAGYRFASDNDRAQYVKDFAAEPVHEDAVDRYLESSPWWDPIANAIGVAEGAGRGVEETAAGIDRLASRATGGQESEPLQEASEKPVHRWNAGAGEAMEAGAEFLSGEELLGLIGKGAGAAGEMMGLTDRMKQAQQLAGIVDRNPKIGKLLKIGASAVKNFTLTGGQTYAKTGGNLGQSLTAGAVGAGAGAAIETGLNSLAGVAAKRATTIENVGGEEMPVPAEARAPKGTAQQEAGKRAITNAAKSTAQAHLEEFNQSRTAPTGAPQLPAATGPFEFNLRGPRPTETATGDLLQPAQKGPKLIGPNQTYLGSSAEPVAEGTAPRNRGVMGADITTEPERPAGPAREARADTAQGGGTFTTQDPNLARAHIANLNQVIESPRFDSLPRAQQQDLISARADAQKQMVDYQNRILENYPGYQKGGALEPVDIPSTLKRIGSFSDAADVLEGHAVKGYDFMNEVTGGKFNAIRQANKDAWKAYAGASGEEAQASAERALDRSNARMDELMQSLRGVVGDRELDGINDAYRNAQALHRVGNAVDAAFSGNPSASARSFEYRGFNGQALMNGLNRVERSMGRPALERVLGGDNLDTLYQVAELNRTQTQRARFGGFLKPVVESFIHGSVGPLAAGGYLGHLMGAGSAESWAVGAGAGWALSKASKAVMDAVLTNPAVAKHVIFAMEAGARPENYGPLIAGLIQEGRKETTQP